MLCSSGLLFGSAAMAACWFPILAEARGGRPGAVGTALALARCPWLPKRGNDSLCACSRAHFWEQQPSHQRPLLCQQTRVVVGRGSLDGRGGVKGGAVSSCKRHQKGGYYSGKHLESIFYFIINREGSLCQIFTHWIASFPPGRSRWAKLLGTTDSGEACGEPCVGYGNASLPCRSCTRARPGQKTVSLTKAFGISADCNYFYCA